MPQRGKANDIVMCLFWFTNYYEVLCLSTDDLDKTKSILFSTAIYRLCNLKIKKKKSLCLRVLVRIKLERNR